jgi:hypothetical protein
MTYDAETSVCRGKHKWTGTTADLDRDGVNDIDVSTPGACAAAGGTWANGQCTLSFSQALPKYGPDTPEGDAPGGAYEKPFDSKKHAGNTIIWYDTPCFELASDGSITDCDFVAIVRGTDGKYCYLKYTLHLQRNTGQDTETLTQTAKAVGAGSVPGVP